MSATVTGSALHPKYAATVDRESAREKLAAKLDAGAEAAAQERKGTPRAKKPTEDHIDYPTGTAPRRGKQDTTVVQDIIKSPVARDLMRTAAREIVRGVFGVGRRR
jgi:hypothetical protein